MFLGLNSEACYKFYEPSKGRKCQMLVSWIILHPICSISFISLIGAAAFLDFNEIEV